MNAIVNCEVRLWPWVFDVELFSNNALYCVYVDISFVENPVLLIKV